jgi:signal transduction histidine kinase
MDPNAPRNAGKLRLSLRLKLTLWMLAVSLVLELTLALVVLLYQEKSIGQFFILRAQNRSETMVPALRRRQFDVGNEELSEIAAEVLRFALAEQLIVALYTAGGDLIASTPRPPSSKEHLGLHRAQPDSPAFVSREVVPGLYGDADDRTVSRVALQRLKADDGREFILVVATTDKYFEAMMGLTMRVLGLSVVIGGIAAGVAGWLIAGLATAPLRVLRLIAGSLSPEMIEQAIQLPRSMSETEGIQKDLQEVRSKLLQALHAQDRFISNASHELKTPIAVLLTEAQILPTEQLPPEARRFVQSVREEMQRLGRMIESFLTLTKLRGGQGLLKVSPCNVNDFVMEAVSSCGKMARQYSVHLLPGLADCDPPMMVSGDARLLRVMIDNLVHNAIRFSPPNHPVRIDVAGEHDQARIVVRDSGPGVPEDLIDKIFDRFTQAPAEVNRKRGYGLGLSIAQGIAELHNGRIEVRNLSEGGCEFTVHLPLVRPTECDSSAGDGQELRLQ